MYGYTSYTLPKKQSRRDYRRGVGQRSKQEFGNKIVRKSDEWVANPVTVHERYWLPKVKTRSGHLNVSRRVLQYLLITKKTKKSQRKIERQY